MREDILKRVIEIAEKYGLENDMDWYEWVIKNEADSELLFNYDFAEAFAKYLLESGKWKELDGFKLIRRPVLDKMEAEVDYIKSIFLTDLALTPDEERLDYLEKLI